MSDAVVRLDASRERLRAAMRDMRGRRIAASAGDRTGAPSWWEALEGTPLLGSVVQGVRSAWQGSPMPTVVRLAEDAGNEALRPTAAQHPLALVGVAMAGGALLYWARPWRTLLRSALFAGVVSQLTARMVSQIPLASVFDAIQTLVARPPAAAPREASNEPTQEGLRHSG